MNALVELHPENAYNQFTVFTDEAFHIHQSSFVCEASVKVHVLFYSVTIIQKQHESIGIGRSDDEVRCTRCNYVETV